MNHIVMKKQPAEDSELINRAELSDFEFVNMDGKRVVCRR